MVLYGLKSRLQHKHTHLSVIAFVWYLSTCRSCKGLSRCFYALPSCVTHPMTSGNTETGRTREAVLANILPAWAESTCVYRPPSALQEEKKDPFPSVIASQSKQSKWIEKEEHTEHTFSGPTMWNDLNKDVSGLLNHKFSPHFCLWWNNLAIQQLSSMFRCKHATVLIHELF